MICKAWNSLPWSLLPNVSQSVSTYQSDVRLDGAGALRFVEKPCKKIFWQFLSFFQPYVCKWLTSIRKLPPPFFLPFNPQPAQPEVQGWQNTNRIISRFWLASSWSCFGDPIGSQARPCIPLKQSIIFTNSAEKNIIFFVFFHHNFNCLSRMCSQKMLLRSRKSRLEPDPHPQSGEQHDRRWHSSSSSSPKVGRKPILKRYSQQSRHHAATHLRPQFMRDNFRYTYTVYS